MVEAGSLFALVRSTPSDAMIVGLTFSVTVAVDLVTAVGVGVGVAVILALRSVARSARIDQVPLESGDHTEEEHALLSEHIVAYRIDGPLFFGAAHRLLLELPDIVDVRVVILRMSRVTTMDATGAHVLGDAITRLERRGIVVLLSGIAPGHEEVLGSLGIAGALQTKGRIMPDTPPLSPMHVRCSAWCRNPARTVPERVPDVRRLSDRAFGARSRRWAYQSLWNTSPGS